MAEIIISKPEIENLLNPIISEIPLARNIHIRNTLQRNLGLVLSDFKSEQDKRMMDINQDSSIAWKEWHYTEYSEYTERYSDKYSQYSERWLESCPWISGW